MFLEGAITTLFITILSIIFGTLLGFAVYMLYRENFSLPNKIINFGVRILQGMPTVVMLLFFYYPSEFYCEYLGNLTGISPLEPLDCRTDPEADQREKILIFKMTGY